MTQPSQQQAPPGVTSEMDPRHDHGEQSYRGCGRLADRKTVVTGADSGIGKAVATAYAREGADVLISHLDEHEDAEDTRRWVEEAGQQAVLVPGDLADPAHCRAVIAEAVEEFGRVDVLVSNAATQRTHPYRVARPACDLLDVPEALDLRETTVLTGKLRHDPAYRSVHADGLATLRSAEPGRAR